MANAAFMAVEPHIDSLDRPTTHWKPRAIVGVPRHLRRLDPLSSTFSRLFQRFPQVPVGYSLVSRADFRLPVFFALALARNSRAFSEQRGAGGHPQQ